MPFQAVPDAYRLDLKYTWDGQIVHNIFGVAPVDVGDGLDAALVGATVADWWIDDMRSNVSNQIALQEVTITPLSTETGDGLVTTTGLPAPGLKTTDSLPNNVAFCVTLRTGLAGRSFRGRSYVPGICDTDAVRSRLDPVVASEIVASYNSLITDLLPNVGARLVVISRKHAGVERPVGIYTPVLSAAAFDNVLDSQRRRLPGRGT